MTSLDADLDTLRRADEQLNASSPAPFPLPVTGLEAVVAGAVRGLRSGDWWVPGLHIGYEHSFIHQVADFFKSLEGDDPCAPTFKDAYETQKVCQAVLDSAASRSWKDTGVDW